MESKDRTTTSTFSIEQSHVTLYVLVPPSPLFAAHWSFFIPDLSKTYDTRARRFEEPSTGRRIHVSGDRLNGFTLEIVRGYDLRKHRGVSLARRFPIGIVQTRFATPSTLAENHQIVNEAASLKDEDEGGGIVDNRPIDRVEQICVAIDPPGPSLRRVAGSTDDGKGGVKVMRKEVKDCQWWVKQVVQQLVDEQVLEPMTARSESDNENAQRPLEVVSKLPVH